MHLRFLAALALACVCFPAMAATQSAQPFGTALAAFIAGPVSVAAVILFLQVPVLSLFQRMGNWFVLALAVALCGGLGGQAWAASDGTEPDPVLTPGAIRTTDRAEIVGVNTATVRNVTGAEKLAVYRRYGMTGPSDTIPGTSHQGPFEVDHRLPLCAGGANDITNLWIQASDGPWTFHDKDALEDRVCRKLKKGVVTVEEAQAVFLGDWKAGYVAEFGHAPQHDGAGH